MDLISVRTMKETNCREKGVFSATPDRMDINPAGLDPGYCKSKNKA